MMIYQCNLRSISVSSVVKRYQKFIADYRGKVYLNQSLARYCTFKVGGPAGLLIKAKTVLELIAALKLAQVLKIPYFILAVGSNVFFDDRGFRGLIINYLADAVAVSQNKKLVQVEVGCKLSELVRTLAKKNLGGMDFLANIPGSVGGAIVGNAGCYGKSISEIVTNVTVFDVKTQKIKILSAKNGGFKYRDSMFKSSPHLIILSAKLKLVKDNGKQILARIAKEKALRWAKHPHQPSAGSFFKNPPNESAWKLIELAGMKGAAIGGAKVSNKHANHIVNYHLATAGDILRLANLVRKTVRQKTGIQLEWEVKFVRSNGVIVAC